MKKPMFLGALMLSALVWAGAQQPSSMPAQSDAQATSPSSQVPSSGQAQPATPGGAEQSAPQAGAPGQAVNAPVTEGCLGGNNPNYTITDSTGKTFKLVLPPNADGTRLAPHVGESVQVMGDVKQAGGSSSIDVNKIGKGTGTCPGAAK